MKFIIVLAVLAVAATSLARDVDLGVVHRCVSQCGPETILSTKKCGINNLYWTDCLIKCGKFEGIGPKAFTCVCLCDLQKFIEKYGNS